MSSSHLPVALRGMRDESEAPGRQSGFFIILLAFPHGRGMVKDVWSKPVLGFAGFGGFDWVKTCATKGRLHISPSEASPTRPRSRKDPCRLGNPLCARQRGRRENAYWQWRSPLLGLTLHPSIHDAGARLRPDGIRVPRRAMSSSPAPRHPPVAAFSAKPDP